ncbi:hypothetical protein FF2_045977 [Malus domestica]
MGRFGQKARRLWASWSCCLEGEAAHVVDGAATSVKDDARKGAGKTRVQWLLELGLEAVTWAWMASF